MAAYLKAKVPVESHVFGKGENGFGLRFPRQLPASRWPELFALWARRQDG